MESTFERGARQLAHRLYVSPEFEQTPDVLRLLSEGTQVHAWGRRLASGFDWKEVCDCLIAEICAVYRQAIEQCSGVSPKGVFIVRHAGAVAPSTQVGVLLHYETSEQVFWGYGEEVAWIKATQSLLGKNSVSPDLVASVERMAKALKETCPLELDVVQGRLEWTLSCRAPSDAHPRFIAKAPTAGAAYEQVAIAYRARIHHILCDLQEAISGVSTG